MASKFQIVSNEVVDPNQLLSLPKRTTIDLIGGIYCHICNTTFHTKKEFDSHYPQHDTGAQDIIYTCVECRKQFAGYPSLRGHCYIKHVNKDRFKCEHCSKHCSKLTALKQHVAAMHTFICSSCNQKFSTKNDLVMHQIIHKMAKSKPPHPCNSCGENIENLDMCEFHIDEHSTTEYPCLICEDTLPSKPEATQHLTKHFGDVLSEPEIVEEQSKPLIEDSSMDVIGGILCCFCDELYKNRIDFDLHFVTEHGDKELVYTCIMCNKKYNKYNPFANHYYFHISKDKFECDECGKTFARLSLLVVHTEAFHPGGGVGDDAGGGGKPFTCLKCDHAFGTASRLREHWRSAHALSHAECPVRGCTRSFSSPHALLLHAREHGPAHAQAPLCRHCGLRLRTRAAAQRHLELHRVKHYSCPVCARVYREKYLLVKHVPQHFETVLHVCKVCGKSYDARSRLIEHAKSHAALRAHTCSYCGKGFVKPSLLEQHLNVHTGRKPYKCTNCPKAFASYPNWAKHLHRMHKVDHKLLKKQLQVEAETKTNHVTVTQEMVVKQTAMKVAWATGTKEAAEAVEVIGPMEAHKPIMATESTLQVTAQAMTLPGDSDDSTLDGIDPRIIERELQMFCDSNNTAQHCIEDFEFEDILPDGTIMPITATAACPTEVVPREYGPEFVNQGATAAGAVIDLDDHIMPHIDPLLTIKQDAWQPSYPPLYQPLYQQLYPPLYQQQCPAYDELADASRALLTDIF